MTLWPCPVDATIDLLGEIPVVDWSFEQNGTVRFVLHVGTPTTGSPTVIPTPDDLAGRFGEIFRPPRPFLALAETGGGSAAP